jgi:hypothetical protein
MLLGFDPLGFSNWIDVRWLREAELKHGRIAMLAVVGFIGTSFVTLPGDVHQVRTYIHTYIQFQTLRAAISTTSFN